MMPKLAIIDDNPDVLRFLTVMLGELHELTCYTSGRAALEGLLSAPPDIVLLDVDLGDMNGIEVARAVRNHAKLGGVPIVGITAHGTASDRAKLTDEGFNAFVAKPIVDVAALVALIDKLLGAAAAPPGGARAEDDAMARFQRIERAANLALDALDAADIELAKKTLRSALANSRRQP
ncbi:MAG: response regulator [Myxococcales bacterium]|nr:response regulator [Myxococcales bacterium]